MAGKPAPPSAEKTASLQHHQPFTAIWFDEMGVIRSGLKDLPPNLARRAEKPPFSIF
jgi:hypothetical protein